MAYGFKSGKNKDDVYTKAEVDDAISAAMDELSGDVDDLVQTKQNKQKTAQVTLTADRWSNNTQTVSCSIVGATDTVIWSGATAEDARKAGDAGLFGASQEENRLTFTCSTTPTGAITLNILSLEV